MTRWTNSALATLQLCGERWRRQYLERDWRPSTPRAIRGAAVHRVARVGLMRKMTERVLPTVEEARDLAADAVETTWRQGVLLDSEERAQGEARVKAAAKDFAVDLAGYHVDRVAPAIEPIGVERRITVQPRDSDLVIEGTIDLIDAQPEGEVIRDLKTSERTPPAEAAERSDQLTMYALIRAAEVGTLPASLALDHLIRTPERHERRHVVQTTTRTPADIAALIRRINTAVLAVERGVFVPAAADAWQCDPRYCPYFGDCAYTQGRARRRTS